MWNRIRGCAVALAASGIVLPTPALQASESQSVKKPATANQTFADVRFSSEGAFRGRAVDATGNALKNAEIVVRQGNKEVARCRADDKGSFSVPKLKSGAYQVSTGTTEGYFRVWDQKTAPPAARNYALIVTGKNGERGQYGAVENAVDAIEPDVSAFPRFNPGVVLLAAGVVAGVTLSAIQLQRVNQLEDRVESLPPVSP